jgi:hypothetical protein
LFTLGMFLVAIGSLGRMWCSLYIAGYKDQVLLTQGPDSMTRNPLYFFSTFGALGVGFARSLNLPRLLLGVDDHVLPARRPEGGSGGCGRALRPEFDDYARLVPALFPKHRLFSEPNLRLKPVVYRPPPCSGLVGRLYRGLCSNWRKA